MDVVEKTDASPEQGKKLRIFLVATMYSTEHYDTWVDMGCPSFEREEIDVVAEQKEYERKEKEKEDAENAKYPEGYVRFENNPEMERIWNLYPSYEAAMTDPERNRYSRVRKKCSMLTTSPRCLVDERRGLFLRPNF